MLAALLGEILTEKYNWEEGRWMDDCLISNINWKNDKLTKQGVMIWGIADDTEQWTDAFAFETAISNGKVTMGELIFWFCDMKNPEVVYEHFSNNRDLWSVKDSRWKYIINAKEALL